MCHYCVQHGEGQKYFLNAKNYATKMYRLKRKEVAKKAEEAEKERKEKEGGVSLAPGAPVDLDLMLAELVKDVADATGVDVDKVPMLRKKAEHFLSNYHYNQVVTLDEALAITDITYPIALMQCVCRRESRGMYEKGEAQYCFALGVGLYKWERWPETYRGITFITPGEAKERLRWFNKRGCVHSITTFYTPYIGGLCNCELPACLAIRGRLGYGLSTMVKGEYVAKPITERCTGCGDCIMRCQFGAMAFSPSRNKVNIDLQKCFGCGLCVTQCRREAIELVERTRVPGIREPE
jgi:NAD-dependent dihydropyrimidine dehydrogenase PreA subunit